MNKYTEKMQSWVSSVRFRHCLFGGVDEADVWKKIEELNSLYEEAICAERVRYDALLEEMGRKNEKQTDADGGKKKID